jgi:hypothetical protein
MPAHLIEEAAEQRRGATVRLCLTEACSLEDEQDLLPGLSSIGRRSGPAAQKGRERVQTRLKNGIDASQSGVFCQVT